VVIIAKIGRKDGELHVYCGEAPQAGGLVPFPTEELGADESKSVCMFRAGSLALDMMELLVNCCLGLPGR